MTLPAILLTVGGPSAVCPACRRGCWAALPPAFHTRTSECRKCPLWNAKQIIPKHFCVKYIKTDVYFLSAQIQRHFVLWGRTKIQFRSSFSFCVLPVNSELLLVIRGPGGVILLGGIVGFMQEHVHQLEVNRPVDLQVNCLLLLLKWQDVILNMQENN